MYLKVLLMVQLNHWETAAQLGAPLSLKQVARPRIRSGMDYHRGGMLALHNEYNSTARERRFFYPLKRRRATGGAESEKPMIYRKNLADELTNIFDNTRKEYAACQTRDRMEQARDGVKNIRSDFAYKHNREAANSILSGARNTALYAVDEQIKSAEGKLIDAPTTDEANYITAITGRTDYTRDEMNAAMGRYKSHAAQKAIINAAKASKLVPSSYMTDEEKDLADLRDLRSSVERTYSSYDFGRMSNGLAAVKKAGYQSFANGGSSTNALDVFGSF